MAHDKKSIDSIVPVISRRATGGWLAVSGPGSPLRIGVEGDTEDDARSKFSASLLEWAMFLEGADADSTTHS